jgi:hypothetical protein
LPEKPFLLQKTKNQNFFCIWLFSNYAYSSSDAFYGMIGTRGTLPGPPMHTGYVNEAKRVHVILGNA